MVPATLIFRDPTGVHGRVLIGKRHFVVEFTPGASPELEAGALIGVGQPGERSDMLSANFQDSYAPVELVHVSEPV